MQDRSKSSDAEYTKIPIIRSPCTHKLSTSYGTICMCGPNRVMSLALDITDNFPIARVFFFFFQSLYSRATKDHGVTYT